MQINTINAFVLLIIMALFYYAGWHMGYESGRIDEREEMMDED